MNAPDLSEGRALVDAMVDGPWEVNAELVRLRAEAARARTLEAALQDIDAAIVDAGPRPDIHERIVERHRREWRTLWDTLDVARALLDTQEGP